jgi:amino acid adenylation domain-containing protein
MSDFSQRIRSLSPERKELLARRLKKRGSQFNSFPLSLAQQRLWLLDQLEPGNSSYNMPTVLRFRGRLHIAVLERSFQAIVQRHESLRTIFASLQGRPVQLVASSLEFSLPLLDLSNLNEDDREREVQSHADQEAQYSFNLALGPLFRISIFRLSAEDHAVFLNIHHIVSDGWSLTVLMRELAATYTAMLNNQPSPLPPLPIQYADYAVWQRQWLQGTVLERLLSYWQQHLAAAPALLDLPTDRPRPAIQTYRGNTETLTLPSSLADHLQELSRKEGVTLYMTLLALFLILLHRFTGQEDLVVGTPIANRNRAEIEGLIGFFVNSLVLRTDLSGDPSFRELLRRVREVALGAYAHQDLSFDKLVEELSPERSLSHTPLFQVFFNMVNLPESSPVWPHLDVDLTTPGEIGSKFDLTLYVTEKTEGIHLELLYNRELFEQARMHEMLSQFAHLAFQVRDGEANISELSLVTASAQNLLPDPTAPLSDHWEGSVQDLFEQQVQQRPDCLAVVYETENLSYQELNRLSNRLAHYLRASGLTRGDVVALYAYRSPALVWAVLGILKAGAAFLILDPAYPVARLIEYLALGNVRGCLHIKAAGALPAELETFLATSSCDCRLEIPQLAADFDALLATYSAENPGIVVGPDDLACITFTSGSTGRPKGILQRHGPLTHFLPWQQQYFGFQDAERYSMLSGLAHDPLQREIFTPLCLGGTIAIPSSEQMEMPGWLAQWMQQQAITIVHLTPAMIQFLTKTAPATPVSSSEILSLRRAFIVGDKLTQRDVARLSAIAPAVHCVNAYGSTETQRAVGYFIIPRAEQSISDSTPGTSDSKEILSLGRGLKDVQLLVLTAAQKLAGIGELGEIYIRSPHLARAYLGDEALTRERFIVNPFTGKAGDRLYKTGDLGRYRADGNGDFAGRNDQQVKIRGFRIELAEIEATLGLHSAVREAVVIVREDIPEQQHLIAYIVSEQELSFAELTQELRAFLATRLPAYMVPAFFISLETLPLTPNRKVDYRALPRPEKALPVGTELSTPAEDLLAQLWKDVLQLEHIGLHENFFELGGHSLLATQLLARVRDVFKVEIPLRSLFTSPTIAGLTQHIETLRSTHIHSSIPAISRALREETMPLSYAQQRLWFLDQWESDSPFYTIPIAVRLTGLLNVHALQHSLSEIVSRHEILRTTIVVREGQPRQVINPAWSVPLPLVDVQELAQSATGGVVASRQEEPIQSLMRAEARRPFDLSQGPLLRFWLLRLEETEHILLLTMHHSIFDGWSIDRFFYELDICYSARIAGKPSPLPPLPIQYVDYAIWQQEWLQGEALAQQVAYWKTHLAGAPTVLELPTDHPRPPIQTYRGAHYTFQLPASLTSALEILSRKKDVTVYMTLLAAFQTLLARYTGQQDIVVGTPIAGRRVVALEELIGFFVNTLVLRSDLSGDPTFDALLGRVREASLEAYMHQDLPFEKLVEELAPERNLSHSPLFQVMFILQNVPMQSLTLADLTLTALETVQVTAKFDLTLVMWKEDEVFHGNIEYNTDLFEVTTIERMSEHFHTLLEGIIEHAEQRLSRLPLLTPAEQLPLLVTWNTTQADYPLEQCIHYLFEQQVERTPDRTAVVWADHTLSYDELNQRANCLAHYLRKRGVGPATLVGLCVERSLDMLVGLLGILKAGGAYVPLDPTYPQERLAFLFSDIQASLPETDQLPVLLTQQRVLQVLPEARMQVVLLDAQWNEIACESGENPARIVGGEDLAYVIYTSGSTGQPKGVSGPHRATINRIYWMWEHFPFAEDEICCQKTSLSFVDSIWEIFGPLLYGVKTVIFADEIVKDPYMLVPTLAEQNITRIVLVPSLLYMMLEARQDFETCLSQVKYWISSGETLPLELAERFLSRLPRSILINLYGSSEVAADATCSLVTRTRGLTSIPIGRPIANTQVYILDAWGQPTPIGVPGELSIGGAGLARGYLNRPDLTAERFVPDPFSQKPGARLYKTGDWARYLPDGTIEYLRRTDRQAKIRGHRIELQEIESVLAQHPGVRQSVVVVRGETASDRRLVAYVVQVEQDATHNGNLVLTTAGLRAFLKERLPEYMLPSAVMRLPALPLTPNGKVDYRALPTPEQEDTEPTDAAVEVRPPTPVEEVLMGVWVDVLGLTNIGIFDNFFERGGHSLLATQVISRVRSLFQADLSVLHLFEAPTIAGFAEVLLENEATPGQVTAMANVRLKLKHMSVEEVREQLKQARKAKR